MPSPERGSFDVNRVDNQRTTSDEVCGRDAALQCVFEQACANSFANPVLIRRELPQQQARHGIGRLAGADRPRQY